MGKKPVKLGPYRIPPGTPLLILTGVLHACEWLYPNASQFDPDRWEREDGYWTPPSAKAVDLPEGMHPSYAGWYRWKQSQGTAADPEGNANGGEKRGTHKGGSTEEVADGDEVAVDRGANRAGRARKFLPFSDGPRNCIG